MTEADYLRSELFRAKSLLAEASGIFNAADKISPDLTELPCVAEWRAKVAEFQTHGVAVLPEGVRADA